MKKLIMAAFMLSALPLCAQETDSLKSTEAPHPIASGRHITDDFVVDTLPTSNEALSIVLFNDNTWTYVRNRKIEADSTSIYGKYWDTEIISPYRSVELSSLPSTIPIELVDSLQHYHFPIKGRITSKYGPRRRRNHNGTDLSLHVGDSLYATFDGRVRYSKDNAGGYGKLVIIRNDNGLETYYGHMSERFVEAGQWVAAGQCIGLGGNTGRSTGPHLHFEVRYMGQSFDAERIINFQTGELRRDNLLLKRSYFSIYSKYEQDFNAEIEDEEMEKKAIAEAQAKRYHIVRRGENLGRIAIKNHTTVTALCRLNNIKKTAILRVGQKLRVR